MTTIAPDSSSLPEDRLRQQPRGLTGDHRTKIDASGIVLIVDDDPDLLEATSFVLEGEGFGVETAKHGKEALERLHAGKLPGVVLLDLMMPVMNGYQFLKEVAKAPSLREIPIVMLSAAAPAEVPGAVEVLRKPVEFGLLIEVVERYVHRAG